MGLLLPRARGKERLGTEGHPDWVPHPGLGKGLLAQGSPRVSVLCAQVRACALARLCVPHVSMHVCAGLQTGWRAEVGPSPQTPSRPAAALSMPDQSEVNQCRDLTGTHDLAWPVLLPCPRLLLLAWRLECCGLRTVLSGFLVAHPDRTQAELVAEGTPPQAFAAVQAGPSRVSTLHRYSWSVRTGPQPVCRGPARGPDPTRSRQPEVGSPWGPKILAWGSELSWAERWVPMQGP